MDEEGGIKFVFSTEIDLYRYIAGAIGLSHVNLNNLKKIIGVQKLQECMCVLTLGDVINPNKIIKKLLLLPKLFFS